MMRHMPTEHEGRLVPVHDTHLFIVERGDPDALPLLVLHGGPGLDHAMFGNHLDPLADRYRLVLIDGRGQGRSDRNSSPASWTLEQHASDVSAVAAAIALTSLACCWSVLVAGSLSRSLRPCARPSTRTSR